MHIRVLVVFLLSFFALAPISLSQDSSPPTDAQSATERARMRFERGVEHYSAGNYDAALAEFQRANELHPSYKLLYNLAQVQVERHDNAAALRLFEEYLRTGGSDVTSERKKEVEQELERLRQSVGELTFKVSAEGARVFVNAAQVGVSPMPEPILVNAGSALIRVEKPGHSAFVETLNIAGDDHRQIDVTLQPLSAAARAPLSQDTKPVPNMTPFWISLGATVALGGATATFGALSVNAHAQQETLLMSYPGRPSELRAASARLQSFAALTDIFAAATVASGIAGLYFYLSPPERRETAAARGAHVRVDATPTGVVVRGAF